MPQIPFFAKEWREYRKLSVKEAARMAEMKVSHLTAIEAREHHFDEHDLAGLANAYEINPVLLLSLNPSDPEDRAVLETAISETDGNTPAEGKI